MIYCIIKVKGLDKKLALNQEKRALRNDIHLHLADKDCKEDVSSEKPITCFETFMSRPSITITVNSHKSVLLLDDRVQLTLKGKAALRKQEAEGP